VVEVARAGVSPDAGRRACEAGANRNERRRAGGAADRRPLRRAGDGGASPPNGAQLCRLRMVI
jgi:hypothetical protein